jgi:hypothetical protein
MANYMQVVARTMDADVINICIEVVFTAVMAYLLSSFLGGSGVWTAYATAQAELSLFLVLRLLLSKDPARSGLESHMLLPKDFGIPEKDRLERSLHTTEEVVALSAEVVSFCKERGIRLKEANLIITI